LKRVRQILLDPAAIQAAHASFLDREAFDEWAQPVQRGTRDWRASMSIKLATGTWSTPCSASRPVPMGSLWDNSLRPSGSAQAGPPSPVLDPKSFWRDGGNGVARKLRTAAVIKSCLEGSTTRNYAPSSQGHEPRLGASRTAGHTMKNEFALHPGGSLTQVGEILRFANALGNQPGSNQAPTGNPARSTGSIPEAGAGFEELVEALFRLLNDRRIHYALVGGVALLRYVPGRNTEDIDLLLGVSELERLPEIHLQERTDWFAKGNYHGVRVDLLFSSNLLFKQILETRTTVHEFREIEVPCATAEGLILLKLFALPSLYRQGQIQRANLYEADVAALLLATPVDPEPLLQQLSPHVSASDLRELRGILAEMERRRDRFRPEP
jgi:hypothetical protein